VPTPILLVEDSDEDILLSRNSLQRAGIANPVFVVKSGDRALAYLQGEGDYADRERFPFPGIMLLDLKMPRMNGFQVLEWRKSQPNLRDLFVVVLSHHDEIRDVSRAYSLGARTFLIKPCSAADFRNLAVNFPDHWQLLHNAKDEDSKRLVQAHH